MQKYVPLVAATALVSLLLVAGAAYGQRLLTNRKPASIEELIVRLKSADADVRHAAFEALGGREKAGLTAEESLVALKAAAETFPPQNYDWQDASAELIRAAAARPRPQYVAVVVANFSAYNGKAREQALNLLARLPDRNAAEAYIALLSAHARDGSLSYLPKGTFGEDPRHADVLFPALLQFADVPALQWNVYVLCLSYLKEGALKPDTLAQHASGIVKAYGGHASKLKPLQRDTGVAWMWEDDYQAARADVGLLLDVLGYLPAPAAQAAVEEAVRFTDPRLAFFAVRGLLRQGKRVEDADLQRIATSAETRNLLLDSLKALGRSDLFPRAWATQEALAESEMVGWLTYPTELASVPDEIELMKVVSEDVGGEDGILDFYLFRFRMHEPHWAAKDGWMAGVAGPFRRADAPTTTSHGYTFSTFEKWDDKRPEEHVDGVREVLRNWAAKKAS